MKKRILTLLSSLLEKIDGSEKIIEQQRSTIADLTAKLGTGNGAVTALTNQLSANHDALSDAHTDTSGTAAELHEAVTALPDAAPDEARPADAPPAEAPPAEAPPAEAPPVEAPPAEAPPAGVPSTGNC